MGNLPTPQSNFLLYTAADGKVHIDELNRIVSAYLDLAENQAKRRIVTHMEDWSKFLHSFLELSKYPILKDNCKWYRPEETLAHYRTL